MTNETQATSVATLALKAIAALDDSVASPHEKMAALKVAAFAIEQSVSAQNTATMIANVMAQAKPK